MTIFVEKEAFYDKNNFFIAPFFEHVNYTKKLCTKLTQLKIKGAIYINLHKCLKILISRSLSIFSYGRVRT